MKHLAIIACICTLISCNNEKKTKAKKSSSPKIQYTIWTKKTELFVAFPALLVNKKNRFTAHLTKMKEHIPLEEGTLTVYLKGKNATFKSESVTIDSKGIFKPAIIPKQTGICQAIFHITSPNFQDSIIVDSVKVYASADEARKENSGHPDDSGISFSKEKAWKIPFQTSPVLCKKIHETIETVGKWKSTPNAQKILVAPKDGIVLFESNAITEGASINKGSTIFRISTEQLAHHNHDAELKNVQAIFNEKKAAFDRNKKLYKESIISQAEWESIEKNYLIAETALEKIHKIHKKQLFAPYSGYIHSIQVNNGDFVKEGDPLITLSKQNNSMLEVTVPISYFSKIHEIENIWFQTTKSDWLGLEDINGKIIATSKEITHDQPYLKAIVEMTGPVVMPKGSISPVNIAFKNNHIFPAIPESALLESYGKYSVIVQKAGDQFELRPIEIGTRNGNWIGVRSGLKENEIIVTNGAYQVKMASMADNAPAHGHAH